MTARLPRCTREQGDSAAVEDALCFAALTSGLGAYFQFVLLKPVRSSSHCWQDEDDQNFVHQLLEPDGLSGFWHKAYSGKSNTLVNTDQLATLDAPSPEAESLHCAGAGGETGLIMLQSTTWTDKVRRDVRT